jgi:proline racemase
MIKLAKIITTIDAHIAGSAERYVIGGIPKIYGKTIVEKKEYVARKMDQIRTILTYEPRGHKDIGGVILTEPTIDEADFGVIFMDTSGYLNMCSDATIGAVTVAIEAGLIDSEEPLTKVIIDSPAGLVTALAEVKEGVVKSVSMRNVPSFVYKSDVNIDVSNIGKVPVDIAFGGNFAAIVDAKELNVQVSVKNVTELIEIGMKIKNAANKQVRVRHPERPQIDRIDLVQIYDKPTHPKANFKNITVYGEGAIDRDPCGTGTSAKIACLYAKGEIEMDEEIVNESIIGTLFKGKIVGEAKVGDFNAIVPEITGTAYITGIHHFIVDPDDPLKYGFLVK